MAILDRYIGFRDINPQAPVHIIVIPKNHIERVSDLDESNSAVVGEMTLRANVLAGKQNIQKDGDRLVINCNNFGGQTVYHLHMHLMGGRPMSWPPG